ncbi:hypothetical protein [Ferrovibrio sp.]|uniref:hypothetical protein n=1 Tax=Ferrovibrio sp. TaxID=1917215 RepID=UPI0035B29381
MLNTYKPTIASLLLTLGSYGGLAMDEQLASQGADIIAGAVGAVITLILFVLKLWRSRASAPQVGGNSNRNGTDGFGLVIAVLLLPLFSLSACAVRVDTETPAQKLFAIQSDLQIAQRFILAYAETPLANRDVVLHLYEAQHAAVQAVMAAQAVIRSGNNASIPAAIAAAGSLVESVYGYLTQYGVIPKPEARSSAPQAQRAPPLLVYHIAPLGPGLTFPLELD